MMKANNIALVVPSLRIGGMERVASILVSHFQQSGVWGEVHLILLTVGELQYHIHDKVRVHQPKFNYQKVPRLAAIMKTLRYLRKVVKSTKPTIILCIGDRWNSFTLLATLGLKTKVFISNRMNPQVKLGRFHDAFSKLIYPRAAGIIVQTELAKKIYSKKYKNLPAFVIGNPIKAISSGVADGVDKENIILNVGRFDHEKNQDLLIKYFAEIADDNWRLVFVGDGPNFEAAKQMAREMGLDARISFTGSVRDVASYYLSSRIFAFTSTTEGFPNALGEALSTPLACISFDCIAGPSDLISDNSNGFLVSVGDHEGYKTKLQQLMTDAQLRMRLENQAIKDIEKFGIERICRKYIEVLKSPQ